MWDFFWAVPAARLGKRARPIVLRVLFSFFHSLFFHWQSSAPNFHAFDHFTRRGWRGFRTGRAGSARGRSRFRRADSFSSVT
jgi:hypothetical protein